MELAQSEILYLSKNIKHPNIADHIQSGMQGRLVRNGTKRLAPYIVMEYYPKGDLFEYMMSSGGFPESIARVYLG